MAELYSALGTRFVYGLNLKADELNVTATQMQLGLAHLPPDAIISFEIGNEPNAYPGYTLDSYIEEWTQMAEDLLPNSSLPWFAGPAFSRVQKLANYEQILGAAAEHMSLFTVHRYEGDGHNSSWTVQKLLEESYVTDAATIFQPVAALVHKAGIPFRIAEMNSLSHGGRANVSNTAAAALWTLDAALNLAHAGIDGINLHNTASAVYSTITEVLDPVTNATNPVVNTPYYACLIFEQAVANGARFVAANTTSGVNLSVWALLVPDEVVRVLVINKDLNAKGSIELSGLPANRTGSLVALKSPSLYATSGLTIAGQTYDNTLDGKPSGEYMCSSIADDVHGSFKLDIDVGEALLLEIPLR